MDERVELKVGEASSEHLDSLKRQDKVRTDNADRREQPVTFCVICDFISVDRVSSTKSKGEEGNFTDDGLGNCICKHASKGRDAEEEEIKQQKAKTKMNTEAGASGQSGNKGTQEDGKGASKKDRPRTKRAGKSQEELRRKIKQCFEDGGAKSVLSHAEQLREDWQNSPLRIGVVGRSGSGKSSFINAIRGLCETDDGAAEVGITETTTKPTRYCHPDMDFLELWDLPGVGTPNFEKSRYLRAIEFQKYDFYIVLSCDRFTDDDLWLSKKICNEGKRLYFVRTKLDIAVDSDKRSKHPEGTVDKVIDKLRKDCESYLEGLAIEPRVFVVSSFLDRNMGEMEALKHQLALDETGLKRGILQLIMNSCSEELIKQKEDSLKKWAYSVALSSGAVGLIPVPGISMIADMTVLVAQALTYKNQFGLDERSLSRTAELKGVSVQSMAHVLGLQTLALTNAAAIAAFLATESVGEITEDVVKLTIPILGSLIAGAASYCTTLYALHRLIEAFANDARKICEFASMAAATEL